MKDYLSSNEMIYYYFYFSLFLFFTGLLLKTFTCKLYSLYSLNRLKMKMKTRRRRRGKEEEAENGSIHDDQRRRTDEGDIHIANRESRELKRVAGSMR